MTVLDKRNNRMGKGACQVDTEGMDNKVNWSMKRNKQSPRYTTCWQELPVAYIK